MSRPARPRPALTPALRAALLALAVASTVAGAAAPEGLLQSYCVDCHNDDDLAAGMSMQGLTGADLMAGANTADWERILRKASLAEMPPRNKPQPSPAERVAFTQWLESSLDRYAAAHPNPGRASLRRLNRAEYANAVRDLLGLRLDVSRELPADDSGYGFDNISDVLTVSPTLMDRYMTVAGKIARLAVGVGSRNAFVTTYQLPKEGSLKNQGIPSYDERMSAELPLDSRGGGSFQYYAPYDGSYQVSGYLNANTNNEVDRLKENRVGVRLPLKAGLHVIGMTFRKQLALEESVQRLTNTTDLVMLPTEAPAPLTLDFMVDGARVGQAQVPSYYMSPRFSQANFPRDVLQIDVEGPFDAHGAGDTPSRRRIFSCRPSAALPEAACARQIVTRLATAAYRRPVQVQDVEALLKVYAAVRSDSDFEHGVEAAVEAVLVSPQFLFLIEQDPPGSAPGSVHRISDLELAARLSLFLWSSLPDPTLVELANRGELSRPAVLAQQVQRLLADPRAEALTQNFAGQWLYLRNLEHQRPDIALFPAFDSRLRAAMLRETQRYFTGIVQENRSILEFIASDYTYLNERLAQHYGIEGVSGTAFRRVSLQPSSQRGGLLGQASILTVTSYGNHTSVVKRGKWILENLLASPPPPPPPDVPALKESLDGRTLTAREQLQLHRANPACASCHVKMDPLGFSLEGFDAVGAYRTSDAGRALDVSAVLPDGTQFAGLAGLQAVLLARKEEFTRAFTERLLTYALGRGLEAYDLPTVRAISRRAAADGYRIQAIIQGIVASEPFMLRRTPET